MFTTRSSHLAGKSLKLSYQASFQPWVLDVSVGPVAQFGMAYFISAFAGGCRTLPLPGLPPVPAHTGECWAQLDQLLAPPSCQLTGVEAQPSLVCTLSWLSHIPVGSMDWPNLAWPTSNPGPHVCQGYCSH